MSYKALIPFAFHGSRVEKGEEIELSKEDLALYGDLVEVAGDTPTDAPAEEEQAEKPLEELSLAELKAKAGALGLPVSGSKADLIERITLTPTDAPAEEEASEDEITS